MMPLDHTIQPQTQPDSKADESIGWRSRIAQHFEVSTLLRISLLTLVGSFVLLVSELFVSFDAGIWISLAALGMSTIVLAAAVERYGKQMMVVIQRLKS